jgi:hypothetical protein
MKTLASKLKFPALCFDTTGTFVNAELYIYEFLLLQFIDFIKLDSKITLKVGVHCLYAMHNLDNNHWFTYKIIV